jgi:hypothetical protein
MASVVSDIISTISRLMAKRRAWPLGTLVAICCLGLALGACSKCDVPNWLPNPSAPHACHDGPPAQ